MVISRTCILFLLLCLINKRSSANPASTTSTTTTTTTLLETREVDWSIGNDKLQDHNEKDEGARDHEWDCQEESDFIQQQIAITTRMLQEGEEVSKKQEDLFADETILVLGKAGSGKTSLVQFLTGNSKLSSKQVNSNTGEYIIEDGEKIGTSATDSFTLYPDLVSYNSTINFCDSPGFHDSRSPAHEIVSMDVMKSVTNKFKKAKILLLENHASLQYGVSKDNFLNTLRHLEEFMVDIDKYRDSIVLIATKIPFTYRMTDDLSVAQEIVTDDMIIESILEYLELTEKSLEEKVNQDINRKKKEFYNKVVRLLQSLRSKDKNGKPTRINLFRRPYKSGSLNNMKLLEENRKSLLNTVLDLSLVDVENSDFDFTLSDSAKMYLECLLRLTSESYKSKINEISFKLGEYMNHKTLNYSSFNQIILDLNQFNEALKQLSHNLDKTKNYNEFFEKVNDFISSQDIPLRYNYNERIHVLEKYEEMLLKFVDTSSIFSPSSWTITIRQLLLKVEEKCLWYQSLNKLIEGLSTYKMQTNKYEIYEKIHFSNLTSTNNFMSVFMNVTGSTNLKQFVEAEGDERRRSEIELIKNSLLQSSNITCDGNGRLIVKGTFVRLSEINSKHLVNSYCNNIPLKEVALLAVDTVFLDEDTDDMFKEVNLFIAAPNWEIIGQRKIVVSGLPGAVVSGDLYLDKSADGKPGLPGDNGGSFFGIGLHFSNGENLKIESNGGQGGPGVDGARGLNGLSGKTGREKLVDLLLSSTNLNSVNLTQSKLNYSLTEGYERNELIVDFLKPINKEYSVEPLLFYDSCSDRYYYPSSHRCSFNRFSIRAEIHTYQEEGDCGSEGERGGFGGEAGIGGFPGKQILIELFEASHIQLENNNGSQGSRGEMGEFGKQGENGVGIICYSIEAFKNNIREKRYWKCLDSNTTSSSCSIMKDHAPYVTAQYITTGIKPPAPTKITDFIYYLLDYAVYLESYSNNTLFNGIITDFKVALRKKFSYNLNEIGLLLFQES